MNFPRLTRSGCFWVLGLCSLFSLSTRGADEAPGASKSTGNDSPAADLKKFQVAPGLKVDSFAAEPTVQNPVSIAFDDQGRLFVVESFRRRSSVFDIRGHTEWLDNDLSFRTVEERTTFLKDQVTPDNKSFQERIAKTKRGNFSDFNGDGKLDWRDLQVETERVLWLADSDNDGMADQAVTYAEGFNSIVSGVAAGVLPYKGDVYFACIPDLWLLRDPDRSGKAQSRRAIHSGFGTHIAFGGHDMHGLIFGPDGKLYWSIADRGTSTNLWAKLAHVPPGLTPELLADSGSIFRCNPDGTEFEVVAWGLRNPQELAFDDYGNLFTADNNGDGGDKARWHHVVDGADFGWRIGWQWLLKMGPWNSERLWHLANSNTASFLIPPLAHIGHGPAGLAYYPGTGLPARYQHHFFLCDFPGYVLAWTNRPLGASFEIGPVENFFGDLGPSDCAFAPGGGLYVSDWTKTFEKTGKGRIYRVHSPEADADSLTHETQKLLREGMQRRNVKQLGDLLAHGDMRIRESARQELVERSRRSADPNGEAGRLLLEIARRNPSQLARVNAIQALAQLARVPAPKAESALEAVLLALAKDSDPEIRAQSAAALGLLEPSLSSLNTIFALLEDPSPRVQLKAAMALSKRKEPYPASGLFSLLRSTQDLYVRHAAIFALACRGDEPSLLAAAKDDSPSVRLAALLALRRLGSKDVSLFLEDEEARVVLEAARAINDVPIPQSTPQLAAVVNRKVASELDLFTLRRALNANFRLGGVEHARALAQFAARTDVPEHLRVEALEMLGEWKQPPGRDKVMGLWRPLPPRDGKSAADALNPILATLLKCPVEGVRVASLRAAVENDVKAVDLFSIVSNEGESAAVRVEALKGLAVRKDNRLADALKLAMAAGKGPLRVEAAKLQPKTGSAISQLATALKSGTVLEKQLALASLGAADGENAGRLLAEWLDNLISAKLPAELQFDLLEAAAKRSEPFIKEKLARYVAGRPKNDPLAGYRELLHGGNAEAGKKVFMERQDVACFRCHKANGEGGEVGPELTGIGKRQSRDYLLESIVFPNRQIASGFESVLVTLKNGTSYAGQVRKETDTEIEINSPEDGLVKVKKADLTSRDRGLSAMPEELANLLSRQDLRNLVEYLSSLK